MKKFLLGNEAIAWGALRAGVRIAASYPGTPSTEIGETFASLGGKYGLYFEWSVNEKVALEVATGGSYHGLRSMASMKNLGLNVASDVLNVISFNGVGGGLLIVSADDPQAHSSTNEQDGRWHAIMAGVPLIEPSNVQEAYDLARDAFDISELFGLPIIMRTVTRLAHMRGTVEVEEPEPSLGEGNFLPRQSYRLSNKMWNKVEGKKNLHSQLNKVEDFFNYNINIVEEYDSEWGIICCGLTYQYAREALKLLNMEEKISLFKLLTPYPIPEKILYEFCVSKKRVLILEELSPFAEIQTRAIAGNVSGKRDGFVPSEGELNPNVVADAIARIIGIKSPEFRVRKNLFSDASHTLTPRTLTLCPGCAYRDIWYVLSRLDIPSSSFLGDIGCYTLLTFPPHNLFDAVGAMGSSLGLACGGYHASHNEIQIAMMGDSTFFHSGIPGLIDAVYNKAQLVLIILDNGTTAMTGFEPHPGTGITAQGEKVKKISLESIARACGADRVEVISPFHLKRFEISLRKILECPGVSVLIVSHPCILKEIIDGRKMRGGVVAYHINEKCRGCNVCAVYSCPAIVFGGAKPEIVEEECVGCGVCEYLCPFFAISAGE
jgi:indolepyruvate ferredoxin oxidoreductase alpha subunit